MELHSSEQPQAPPMPMSEPHRARWQASRYAVARWSREVTHCLHALAHPEAHGYGPQQSIGGSWAVELIRYERWREAALARMHRTERQAIVRARRMRHESPWLESHEWER